MGDEIESMQILGIMPLPPTPLLAFTAEMVYPFRALNFCYRAIYIGYTVVVDVSHMVESSGTQTEQLTGSVERVTFHDGA